MTEWLALWTPSLEAQAIESLKAVLESGFWKLTRQWIYRICRFGTCGLVVPNHNGSFFEEEVCFGGLVVLHFRDYGVGTKAGRHVGKLKAELRGF